MSVEFIKNIRNKENTKFMCVVEKIGKNRYLIDISGKGIDHIYYSCDNEKDLYSMYHACLEEYFNPEEVVDDTADSCEFNLMMEKGRAEWLKS